MIHGLDELDITGYSPKLLGKIQSKQLLTGITTKHDCNGQSSIQIDIATGGTATPHISGSDVKDCWGSVRKETITTQDWEAGT
jgi:hypothetical protein